MDEELKTLMKNQFEKALVEHRDKVLNHMKESAERYERQVPQATMNQTRAKSLNSMEKFNLIIKRLGGNGLAENELVNRMSKAEGDAVQLYVQQKVATLLKGQQYVEAC